MRSTLSTQKLGDTMKKKDEYILVFDSGLGGLNVLKELIATMPRERYIYLGDSRNAPYGSKSTHEVASLTLSAIESQVSRGVKAIVVACNTATSAAIETLRKIYPNKVVIGIEPALKLAAERHSGESIVVMATEVTLREAKFAALMERFSATNPVLPLQCPRLVSFVESGELDSPALREYLKELLSPVLSKKPHAIVLGCTHFPFLRPVIQEIAGNGIEILDGSQGTAQQTRRRLETEGLLREQGEGSLELVNSLGTPEILELSCKLLEQ